MYPFRKQNIFPQTFVFNVSFCDVNTKTFASSTQEFSDKVCCSQYHRHLPYPWMSPRRQVTNMQHPEELVCYWCPRTQQLGSCSLISLCSCCHRVITELFVFLFSVLMACHFPLRNTYHSQHEYKWLSNHSVCNQQEYLYFFPLEIKWENRSASTSEW